MQLYNYSLFQQLEFAKTTVNWNELKNEIN